MYKRVLLKLSGEQLAGKFDGGVDVEFCSWLASEVNKVIESGSQVVIMVGGGNYARGAQLSEAKGIGRVTADYVGMMATMMNALVLGDIFNHVNVHTHVVTVVKADLIADQFTHRRAVNHLDKGRVVIVAGGSGRPYVTTDTAAAMLALELDCDVVLKATKVDGVYDKDPAKYEDAKKIDRMNLQQAVGDDEIKVMDKAALGLAMEHQLPIIVFDATVPDNIVRASRGEAVGTTISA